VVPVPNEGLIQWLEIELDRSRGRNWSVG